MIAAMADPPDSTRAYFRGTCLARWADSVVAANWDSLVLDVGIDPLRRIPMMEPTRGSKEHVAELFAGIDTSSARRATDLELRVAQEVIVMPERERKQKPAPKEREEVVDEEVAASSERGEKLKEDIDDLWTRSTRCSRTTPRNSSASYVQKGGQ